MALTEWGNRWAALNGPPVFFTHDECGGSVHVTAGCDGCGKESTATEVVAVPGPGATDDQLNRVAR